jgi:hypothetical protein
MNARLSVILEPLRADFFASHAITATAVAKRMQRGRRED